MTSRAGPTQCTASMQTLTKQERLRGEGQVGRLFSQGARGSTRTVLALALPAGEARGRVAFIAGKKLGRAVVRNRLRRRLRAAFRLQKDAFPQGIDLALMAKRELLEAQWPDVMRDVTAAAAKAAKALGEGGCGRPPHSRSR